MTRLHYELAMYYLGKIEDELNHIAVKTNHPTMDEFFESSKQV